MSAAYSLPRLYRVFDIPAVPPLIVALGKHCQFPGLTKHGRQHSDPLCQQTALLLVLRPVQYRLELANAEVQRPGVGALFHRKLLQGHCAHSSSCSASRRLRPPRRPAAQRVQRMRPFRRIRGSSRYSSPPHWAHSAAGAASWTSRRGGSRPETHSYPVSETLLSSLPAGAGALGVDLRIFLRPVPG